MNTLLQRTYGSIVLLVSDLRRHTPKFLGHVDGNPDTSDWGAEQEGTIWYDRTAHKLKFWTGAAVQTITSA